MEIPKIEIACFNRASARIAQQHGADRVEFCMDIQAGGVSPDMDETRVLRQELHLPLYVMIRPRGGNFVYSPDEFAQMQTEIIKYEALGVDGFVFGILDTAGNIDMARNRRLIRLAGHKPCTFHRAFDEVADPIQALEDVINCGFTTLLTSGCKTNVDAGQTELGCIIRQAEHRIVVMPGGGLRSTDITRIRNETGAIYFHSSAITDGSETAVSAEVQALVEALKL